MCEYDSKLLTLLKAKEMIVERTPDEIIIKIPSHVDIEGLQEILDYLEYKEATSKSLAQQKDVDNLVQKVKKGWSEKYRRPKSSL